MKKLLAATFVALLMVGCDGTDRVGRELREGFSRKHNKGSAEKRRQAVLAELNWAKRSNPTELKLSSIGSIADLTPLKGLTNLEVLAIKVSVSRAKKNRYTDLTPLAELENLEDLYIDCNYPGFNSLKPLARLTKLKRLTLYQKYGTSSATRDPLKGLTNLRYLNLYENQNPDITALAGLTNLTELSLGRNKITDITPLTGLIQLKTLNLWENHVTDLTPLTGLTKLEKLNLYGNPIPKDQFDMLIKALPDCEIKGLSYDYYSNGQKKSEFYYKDSQLERGATKWYSNGQKMVEGNFKNGKLWTAVAWKPNGEKCPVTNVVNGNGVVVVYEEDGTERVRLTFKNGEEVEDERVSDYVDSNATE
jgi:hypothetical protein